MINKMNFLCDRCKNVRRDIITIINNAKAGHIGGSLSCVEILTSLYFEIMNIDPGKPDWERRDRFILSKGHATAAYYATLANRGYFKREDLINLFININSNFEEHGDSRNVPGVDISTGSLGQGPSIGAGMALASKFRRSDFTTYVLIGDGECQEGQIWESAMFASNYKLDNLFIIIDKNDYQVCGSVEEVISIEPLKNKWLSFNWEVLEVNGHDLGEIIESINFLKSQKQNGHPKLLIAKTTKGRGISFIEEKPDEWHSFKKFTESELKILESEIGLKCN